MNVFALKMTLFVALIYASQNAVAYSANISSLNDCLIIDDIGGYNYRPRGANLGAGSGAVGLTGHFNLDHGDNVCTGTYSNINQLRGLTAEEIEDQLISIKVQVTQHSGDDSDKWLLHEIDLELRNYYGTPGHYLKTVAGNTIYVYGAGGRNYRWLSGNKVIVIDYHDSQLTKPEPIEIVQAYLAKHPSTLPAITMKELYSSGNKIAWIKDEMDRRLWLCDKWFKELQFKRAEEKDVYREAVKSMIVFINYREKYYGIKAEDDKNLLENYLYENNGTGIKAKLTEYKNWWGVNKSKSISL